MGLVIEHGLSSAGYYTCQAGKITIIPYVRVAWEHEGLYSDLPITVSAPALGEATVTFNGPAIGHDSLIINANVGIQWTPRISTTIGYDGQLGRGPLQLARGHGHV